MTEERGAPCISATHDVAFELQGSHDGPLGQTARGRWQLVALPVSKRRRRAGSLAVTEAATSVENSAFGDALERRTGRVRRDMMQTWPSTT